MKRHLRRGALATAIVLAFAAGSAHAVLERVGPVNPSPSTGNFPAWYQDKTGLVLEFCDPKNQAELDGGYCLLLPGDVPSLPESLAAGNFFDEHFYFAADALINAPNGASAGLTLALESAFTAEVVDGGQIVFARIRVRLDNVPVSGMYRFVHPYGEDIIPGVAGQRIFFTDDVGINCPPGQFDCALESRLGPFLLPSDAPGGAEQPPVAGPSGKLHIADPARTGPVTGSTLPNFVEFADRVARGELAPVERNHNIFRIEGPAGSNLGGPGIDFIETTDFALMGRVFQGALAGRTDVKRADYARTAASTQLDVFATTAPSMTARVPGQPVLEPVTPQLSMFPAPCGGVVDPVTGEVGAPFTAPGTVAEVQMFAAGNNHWGQAQPTALPGKVCVKDGSARDINGQLVPTYTPHKVADTVVVTDAYYDPTAKTLVVSASSSDQVTPPAMKLAFDNFLQAMPNGSIQVTDLAAPPAKVRVHSDAGGVGELTVRTGVAPAVVPTGPVAINDTVSVLEDTPGLSIAVLGNDSNAAGATVAITAQPRLGAAVLNADGTVTYTPRPDVNGTDAFSYTATVNGQTSSPANVTITIIPVNDAPVAVDEAAAGIAGGTVNIDVAANDIDADGNGDIVGVAALSAPVGTGGQQGATATANGRVVSFKALLPGTYTFTYKPVDSAGAASENTGTVTVNVVDAEAVNVARAEFITKTRRLRVEGTIAPAANQKIQLTFTNSAGTQLDTILTETVSDALGAWAFDISGYPLPNGASLVKATSVESGTSATIQLRIR